MSGPTRRKRQRRAPGQRREGDLPALFPTWWFGWPSLVIDCVLVTLLLFPVSGLAMGFAAAFVPAESREGFAVLAVLAAAAAYWLVPLGRWGQTAGMKVVGIRIVRAGHLDLPGYRLAFVALMSRLRPVPALVTVDDAVWRGWMAHSAPEQRAS